MITIRGQILVSRTNDDPLHPRVYVTKALRLLIQKRPRVYRHHAHMLKHMCAWCRHTRFECTHGGRLVHTHTVFSRFFSVPQHTPNTHHDHNDTHHTTPHGDRDRERDRFRERQRERETERDRETEKERQRKRDKTRDKRSEHMIEKMKDKMKKKRQERRSKTREETR